jgi:hypothetical protein
MLCKGGSETKTGIPRLSIFNILSLSIVKIVLDVVLQVESTSHFSLLSLMIEIEISLSMPLIWTEFDEIRPRCRELSILLDVNVIVSD